MLLNSLSSTRFAAPPPSTRVAQPSLTPAHQQREGVNFKDPRIYEANQRTLMSLLEHLCRVPERSEEEMDQLREAIELGLQELQENGDTSTLTGVLELNTGFNSMGGPQLIIHLNPPQADEAGTSTSVFLSNFDTPLLVRLGEFFKGTLQQAKNVVTVNNFFPPTAT